MWFFEAMNPNNAIASVLGKDPTPDTCNLQYFHKSGGGQAPGGYSVAGAYTAPSPEGDDFTECHPWKSSSCCHQALVTTPEAINAACESWWRTEPTRQKVPPSPPVCAWPTPIQPVSAYPIGPSGTDGEGYLWNRCDGWVEGYSMSDACQRFFVQEACMYECSPHAGQYRAQRSDSNRCLCLESHWRSVRVPCRLARIRQPTQAATRTRRSRLSLRSRRSTAIQAIRTVGTQHPTPFTRARLTIWP